MYGFSHCRMLVYGFWSRWCPKPSCGNSSCNISRARTMISSTLARSDTPSVKSMSVKVSRPTARNIQQTWDTPVMSQCCPQIWFSLVHPILWSCPDNTGHWIMCGKICSVSNNSADNVMFCWDLLCTCSVGQWKQQKVKANGRRCPNLNFNLHLWASASVSQTHQKYCRGTMMSMKYWLRDS